jgi:hypothetical protein
VIPMAKLDSILALKPRSKLLQQDIASRLRHAGEGEVVESLNRLEEALIMMCTMFFEVSPSSSRKVETLVVNDHFQVSAIYVNRLAALQGDSRLTHDENVCIEILGNLLLRLSSDRSVAVDYVKPELVVACILAVSLRNERLGRPVMHGMTTYDFIADDDLFGDFQGSVNLLEIVNVTRRLFPLL